MPFLVSGLIATTLACSTSLQASSRDKTPESVLDSRYFYDNAEARIKWDEGTFEVRAGATADPKKSVNLAHARSIAIKTARHLAYEKLLETVKGISLTSDALYHDELIKDSVLEARLEGFVMGARVAKEEEKVLPDGSLWVEVTLVQRLRGRNSLTAASKPAVTTKPGKHQKAIALKQETDKKSRSRAVYSGVVIDARHLGVRPALFPKIVTPAGRAVYSPSSTSEEYILAQGLVGYAISVERARQLDRVGKNPLVIKAERASGAHRADVVVSEQDAVRIVAANMRSKILNEARVVFVIN